jgi:hypothetical protein
MGKMKTTGTREDIDRGRMVNQRAAFRAAAETDAEHAFVGKGSNVARPLDFRAFRE